MGDAVQYHSPTHVGSHNYADLFVKDGHEVFWDLILYVPLNLNRDNRDDWDRISYDNYFSTKNRHFLSNPLNPTIPVVENT